MVLTYNTFMFFTNAVNVNTILLYDSTFVLILVIMLSILMNIWAGYILFWGLTSFTGYSKKVSLNFCISLFFLNIILLGVGFLINA